METYDFSALASDTFGSDMSGMGGGTNSFGSGMGGGTNSFGSGMGGGTNSFGSGGGFGSGMSEADLTELFAGSPWGGLADVGFSSFEQVFRGNTGGNLQRSERDSASGGTNNQGGDSLLTGGDGTTSASAYSYNFSQFQ